MVEDRKLRLLKIDVDSVVIRIIPLGKLPYEGALITGKKGNKTFGTAVEAFSDKGLHILTYS